MTQFKVEREQERLAELTERTQQKEAEAAALDKQIEKTKQKQVNIERIDKIEAKSVMLSPSRVSLEKTDYETLSAAAKKYYVQEKKVSKLQRALEAAHKTIDDLKAQIKSLKAEIASLRDELFQYKSVRNKLNTPNLQQENEHLRSKLLAYENVIYRNNMWHLFGKERSSTRARDGAL